MSPVMTSKNCSGHAKCFAWHKLLLYSMGVTLLPCRTLFLRPSAQTGLHAYRQIPVGIKQRLADTSYHTQLVHARQP